MSHKFFKMKPYFSLLVAVVLIIASCSSDSTSNPQAGNTTVTDNSGSSAPGGMIVKNNIVMEPKGVRVSQAILVDADGKQVPENNGVNLGEPIRLRLVVDNGWNTLDGAVLLDASQRIEAPNGKLLLEKKGLLRNDSSTTQNGRLIYLPILPSRFKQKIDSLFVTFRVWDNNGTSEINGSYKLYLKDK